MGRLELRKYDAKIYLKDNKVVTNLPIDWDKTLRLWYEDKESYDNRTLVRMEEKEVFKIHYNRSKADYNNQTFYEFNPNRELRKELKKRIKDGKLDAFKC